MRNAGAGNPPGPPQDLWSVSSADWLVTWGIGVPADEKSNTSLHVEIDPAKAALLGDGVYVATVSITDGSSSFAPVTVEMTVTNNTDVGPRDAVLPDLRHDQVVQIEAEHFDLGGNNVGFYDPDGNDHVEEIPGGFAIVEPPAGDWYNYTVNVPADGWYRAEMRLRGGGKVKWTDHAVEFIAAGGSAWQTIRPGGGIEEFVYLSYGVQVQSFSVNLSDGLDIDWLRLSPVNANTQAGIPLPYPAAAAPVVSQFADTTVQAEHFDKGGVGVGYSDNWDGNTLSDFRAEEQVALAQTLAASPPAYAVRGPADRWVGYTVDVTTPGHYKVTLRAATASAADTLISLRTADDEEIGVAEVPGTGDFTAYTEVSLTANFLTTGRKTLRLHFDLGQTQVDWLKFEPVALSLAADLEPPTPTPAGLGNFKTVGTLFAVNAPGKMTGLRFYMTGDEAEYIESKSIQSAHTLRLWRIEDQYTEDGKSYSTNYGNGNIHPNAITLIGQTGASSATADDGWVEVPLTTAVDLQPGLYMVSNNVVVNAATSKHYYSFSTHDALGPARPSVLNVVAGTIPTSPAANAPPNRLFYDLDLPDIYPNGFFWVDVLFSPEY